MGREAIIAALCWFTVGGALAVDNLRDDTSVSRLYRNLPNAGVYASGAPYGAYSFQIPLVAAPSPSASRVIPQNYSFQNMNAHLKDSYGNRFVEPKQSLQSMSFKPFPQQYIQLQELPAHFAQPLPAPSFAGYKQATPQVIVGSQYRLPLQNVSPIKPQYSYPQGIYAGNIKSLAPQSISPAQFHGPLIRLPVPGQSYTLPGQSLNYASSLNHNLNKPGTPSPTAQQQSTSNEAIYANVQNQYDKPKFQRPQVTPQESNEAIYANVQNQYDKPKFQRQQVTPQESNEAIFANVQNQYDKPKFQRQQVTPQVSNEAIYANVQSHYNDEPKFQRQQETPQEQSSEEETAEAPQQIVHHSDTTDQKSPIRETTITSFMNGRKTRVNLKTKPTLPLLDISLLEPLTFENPLVPQVQHFLPKLSQATYHKLPEFTQSVAKKYHKSTQKTKIYDGENDKGKPKKFTPKKKQKYPLVEVQNSYYDEVPSASTVRPVIADKGTANESPEFSYEINSPNYKETYKEQAINYNKETNSEPVTYTYGTQKHEEPVHYTYVHSSKEPIHIKEVRYEGKGEGPKHLVHKFMTDEHKDEKHQESEESGESSDDDRPHHSHNKHRDHHNEHGYHQKHHKNDNQHHEHHNPHHVHHNPHNEHHNQHHEKHNQKHEHQNQHHKIHHQHHESPKPSPHLKPEHRDQEYHHNPSSGSHQNQQDGHINPFKPIKYYTQTSSGSFQPISEYEEEIQISAPIKVNPHQHVQPQPESRQQNPSQAPQSHNYHNPPQHKPAPQHNHQSAPAPHQKHHVPTTHIHEKTKSVMIQEETPEHTDEDHSKMFDIEEDKEKDFENAYKNAAFGFPAYGKTTDFEKDIYNPDSYGIQRDHSDYDFKNTPFQQYHDQSDNFPKSSRLSYKDTNDKTKEDYFLDFSISKPESLTDHYKKKVDYYKLYKNQKPEKYIAHDNASPKKEKTSEKYTAIPYNFYPTQDLNMKQFLAQYKAAPLVQEFDYSKGTPRDSSAFSTQPYHRYKSNTFFVEPQFQYGFEPISIPRLLDSELATMASNHSPESEKPGMRKKIYKENFYIKKTSMSDVGHNS